MPPGRINAGSFAPMADLETSSANRPETIGQTRKEEGSFLWFLVKLFVVVLIGTVITVGALTFVPALALGPVVEHLLLFAGT